MAISDKDRALADEVFGLIERSTGQADELAVTPTAAHLLDAMIDAEIQRAEYYQTVRAAELADELVKSAELMYRTALRHQAKMQERLASLEARPGVPAWRTITASPPVGWVDEATGLISGGLVAADPVTGSLADHTDSAVSKILGG